MIITYLIENTVDGRKYVGCTKRNITTRLVEHKSEKHRPLGEDIAKLGIDKFKISILCTSKRNMERFYIKKFGSLFPNGYNLESGGSSGFDMHPRSKMELSIKHSKMQKFWLRKPVVCTTTGNTYESLKDAAEKLSLDMSHISKVLRGKRNQTGGLNFAFQMREDG